MIEYERKFRVAPDSVPVTADWLTDHGEPLGTSSQSDVVLLRGATSFDGFVAGEPVARIRTTQDGRVTLTVKAVVTSRGDCREHEIEIDSTSEALGILDLLGFRRVVVIEKHRRSWRLGSVTVAIDEVVGLGTFVEVEWLCSVPEGDSAQAETVLSAAAADLGLRDADRVSEKYDQLLSATGRASRTRAR